MRGRIEDQKDEELWIGTLFMVWLCWHLAIAVVAYLTLIVILNPLSTCASCTFSPCKMYWAKPDRAYPAPDSMHAFRSSELRLEVMLCSLVTLRVFWSESPTVLDICFVSGRWSRMWHIPWVIFPSCGCTRLSGHWQARKHCAYIYTYRVFWIKFVP